MQLIRIAKICIYILLFYILWFIYVFGEKTIILYGSTGLATVCILIDMFMDKRNISNCFPKGVLINLIMCFYSLLFGLFVAVNLTSLVGAIKTYLSYTIICLSICYISKKEKSFDWLLNAFIIADVVISIYIITQGFYIVGYGYVLSPKNNPNVLGVAMDFGVFCTVYKVIRSNKKNTLLYIVITALFLYILVGCGSRKCLLAALGLCLLWIVPAIHQQWKKGDWANRFLLLALIGVFILLLKYYYQNIYVNTNIYNRMEVLGDGKDESSRLRELYYQYAIAFFSESPIFGIGLAQFAEWNPLHGYAHSTYAEILADWGFIGCTIYLVPVIWAGMKLIRNSFSGHTANTEIIVLALWIMEMFLGIGQIWIYLFEHMVVWTVIFIHIDLSRDIVENEHIIERNYKYVKV